MSMTEKFNTDSILNEIKIVIDNGLQNLLNDFMGKYNEYEENYNAVLNLPAVKNKIGALKHDISNSASNNGSNSSNIISTMYKTFNIQMKQLQKENEELRGEIERLKKTMPPIIDLTNDDTNITEVKITEVKITEVKIKEEPVVSNEKENITLVIEEQSNNDEEKDDEESEEEEESVKSLEEEDEEDEEEEEEVVEESVASLEVVVEEVVEEVVEDDDEQSVETETKEELEEEEEEEELEEEELEEEEEVVASLEEVVEEVVVVASLEEEEEELFEIEIDDKTYCTNNEETGFIYELDTDGNVGDKIGYFKESEPIFYSEE
jgi:hypothetical protein